MLPIRAILLLLAAIVLQAKDTATFRGGEYRGDRERALKYRIYVPENIERNARYPLVIWLHDIRGIGVFNRSQISGTDAAGAKLWIARDIRKRYPAFVLAPQCPLGSFWVNFLTRQPSAKLLGVTDLIADLVLRYPIDPKRLYLVGQSMGGFGVWALLESRPDLFAAAIPVAGGGDTGNVSPIARIPVWAFHGKRDIIVNVRESRRMIAALQAAGGNPRYTEYPRLGHGSRCWREVFSEPQLPEWLFAQQRTD